MGQATRDRRQKILEQLFEHKHLTVHELVRALGVSPATVRRDLRALASQRQITLVHGGATLTRDNESSFNARRLRNLDAKRVIGRLAAELVSDDDQIFLDSGTTCFEMVSHLKHRRNLRVIVNSARLALEFDGSSANVILLGGQYRPARMDTVGPIAINTLSQLRGYTAFVGADGLSMDFGPSAADIESADLYRRVLANARQAVLVVDHSKFQSASLFRIVEWSAIHCLVTDRQPDPAWMDFLRTQNIRVIYPHETAVTAMAESAASHETSADPP